MTTALAENHRRKTKVIDMRARGVDPYPHFRHKERTLVAEIFERHGGGALAPGAHDQFQYQVMGRLIGRRRRGPVTLLEVRDRSGSMLLLCVPRDDWDRETTADWDIGDFVGVRGSLYVADDGKVGLEVHAGALLVKALRRPPTKGGSSQGSAGRRELELLSSAALRSRYARRAAALDALREWMQRHDFVEVETPILQAVAGGALARPFITHHNALNIEASLRISAELFLRRCTVGDLERVFDVGKRFRNEGLSRRHNPEFTMFEWLMAYSDYLDAASFTEGLISHMATRTLSSTDVVRAGEAISFGLPWRRAELSELISTATGLDMLDSSSEQLMATVPSRDAIGVSWAQAVQEVYAAHVEPALMQPTIVLHFPAEQRPCVKRHPSIPELCESFDVVAGGLEIGSGGTAIDDPEEQWRRFGAQGPCGADSEEPHPRDREYVETLEYGAPPAAGSGIGIDRLLMVMLDVGAISEVLSFTLGGTR